MRRAAVSAILAVQIGSPLAMSAQNSQAWDSRFRAIPDAKTIGEHMRRLTARPKEGWRPKRTIVYAAWDGEEPMLLGSTEWVEDHEEELRRRAVVYINSDNTGRGFLSVSGSHTLEHFVNSVAHDVGRSRCQDEHLETAAGIENRARGPGAEEGGTHSRRSQDRRARLGIGLLRVPATQRHRKPRFPVRGT
jgi:hypothetical protein